MSFRIPYYGLKRFYEQHKDTILEQIDGSFRDGQFLDGLLVAEVEKELENAITNIKKIIQFDIPPEPIKIPFCSNCAYKDMCWS